MRLAIGSDDITYLCQRRAGHRSQALGRKSDTLSAYAWTQGAFTCVAVGNAATERLRSAFPK